MKKTIKRILSTLLYLACIGWLVQLLRTSGMKLDWRDAANWLIVLGGISIWTCAIFADTLAWRAALRFSSPIRPGIGRLLTLRLAGEAVTNAIPGGFVFGESIKAMRLKDWTGMSITESTPSLLLVKFGLGYSQVIFVFVGIMLGFGLTHPVALVSIFLMCAVMALPYFFLRRGGSFVAIGKFLQRFKWGRRLVDPRQQALATLDDSCTKMMRQGPGLMLTIVGWLSLRWLAGVAETYFLLHMLGVDAPLETAFVIESLGSMFRLLFFIVPSGVGGQDASFFALFTMYEISKALAGSYVAFKRARELFWIALGFLLVFLSRPKKRVKNVSVSESTT